jgi:hypothetical protein
VYLAELKDLHCVIPNDIFNNHRRSLHTAAGEIPLLSPPDHDGILNTASRWVNMDDRLGIVALYGGDHILLDRSTQRRAGKYASLFTEEICLHARRGSTRCRAGEILVDVGFAVLSGATAAVTSGVEGGPLSFPGNAIKGAWVDGADGIHYELIANVTSEPQSTPLQGETITLAGGTAIVRANGIRVPGINQPNG